MKGFPVFLLLLVMNSCKAQQVLSLTQTNGLKVLVVNKNLPLLKLLLPGQAISERGIEIEFPEHVTGLNEKTNVVEHLYFVTRGNANKRTLPRWHIEGDRLFYETALDSIMTMIASVHLEPDGLRYNYKFINHSTISYRNLQAVTCVKLYSEFSDTLLQRTYVHHATGFELMASETPGPLARPCRYLVSYSWPVVPIPVQKGEDFITRYNKSRKADKPFIATLSHDKKWIAATYTKETGNLWTNPERTCQHADPSINLGAGETKTLALKTFIIKGTLDQLLQVVAHE